LVKTIVFTPRAAKEFDGLPAPAKAAVEEGLCRFAIEGRGDVKRLQGVAGYRLRIGDYRVIFDDDGATLLTLTIGRRTTATYKRDLL
jgi:mRNA interferase RelE/StbE